MSRKLEHSHGLYGKNFTLNGINRYFTLVTPWAPVLSWNIKIGVEL